MIKLKYRLVENNCSEERGHGYRYDLQHGTKMSNGEIYWHSFLMFKNESDAIKALDEVTANN